MAFFIDFLLAPEHLRAELKPEVIEWIRVLAVPAQRKGYLYSQWARRVGVLVEADDFAKVITPLERSE